MGDGRRSLEIQSSRVAFDKIIDHQLTVAYIGQAMRMDVCNTMQKHNISVVNPVQSETMNSNIDQQNVSIYKRLISNVLTSLIILQTIVVCCCCCSDKNNKLNFNRI